MIKIKYINVLALLFVCIFIAGCYESTVPLSSPKTSKIDKKLVNYWRSIPEEKDEKNILLAIFKINENEFLLNWQEGNDGNTIMARGFITKINNTNIINVQNIASLKKNERTYFFFKYTMNNLGNLRVQILSDDSPLLKNKKFKSSEKFYNFIKENISNDKLFGRIIKFKPIKNFKIKIIP